MLVLCAGVELDGGFAAQCRRPGDQQPVCSFSLSLAALRRSLKRRFATAPLRRWRLIDVHPGDSLMTSPLRIDERVLHFLCGVDTDRRVCAR
jgi:hypothetical protein